MTILNVYLTSVEWQNILRQKHYEEEELNEEEIRECLEANLRMEVLAWYPLLEKCV